MTKCRFLNPWGRDHVGDSCPRDTCGDTGTEDDLCFTREGSWTLYGRTLTTSVGVVVFIVLTIQHRTRDSGLRSLGGGVLGDKMDDLGFGDV